ncbi:MAG: DNA mismatch repair endonuclease MutL, partial [Planctomycetaceae bacterium]|nr:DNA mismatch repair endonuclease MutL [Planctomycetaceae bacterium]
FNTPVRRKYLKSTVTEFGHITESFVRLALPLPQIHFTLTHNGKIVYDLPPALNTPLQAAGANSSRVAQLFGDEVAKNLIYVESRPGNPVQVKGFVSHPNNSRINSRMQYFFLNNRFIRDKSLQHALGEAYRGLLTVGRFPLAFLQIEIPPDMFDVNVHPAKMEVRWLDSNRIYSGFLGAIREKFLTTDLNGTVERLTAGSAAHPENPLDETAAAETKRRVIDWLGQQGTAGNTVPRPFNSPTGLSLHTLPERNNGEGRKENGESRKRNDTAENKQNHSPLSIIHYPLNSPEQVPAANVVQLHSRYIVIEVQTGVGIIDQHALHERILYEKLKAGIEKNGVDSQKLLVPQPVDLSPNEFAAVLEYQTFIKSIGLSAEPFGGETVLITAVPAILSEVPPEEVLLAVLEPLLTAGKKHKQTELLEEMMHSVACKAAVKAGEHLSPESVQRLVELAKQEQNSHHCPHGRPSMLVLSIEELDKMFRRT